MSNANFVGNKWRLAAVALTIVVIVLSSFVVLYKTPPGVSATPAFLEVSISGPDKIGANTPTVFTASVANSYSDKLEYIWSISPQDDKTTLQANGDSCVLTFIVATEEPYVLSVQARDLVVGNLGSASKTVHDPYTSPNLYLGAYGAPYSYLIETDGLGWYRAINGSNGKVEWSSTDAASVFTSVQANGASVQTVGDFTFTSTVTISVNNFTLSTKQSTINIPDSFNRTVFSITGANNKIQGFTFDGNKAGQTAIFETIRITGNNIEVSGCRFTDQYYYGIQVIGADNYHILNNYFDDFNNALVGSAVCMAIGVTNGTNGLIQGNDGYNGGQITLQGYGSHGNTVTFNHFIATGTHVWHGGLNNKGGYDNIFSNNYVQGFDHSGIEIQGYNNTISTNMLVENNVAGVEVFSDSTYQNCADNTITGNVGEGNLYAGISLYSTGTGSPNMQGTLISGNNLNGNYRGLYLHLANYFTASDNQITNSTSHGITMDTCDGSLNGNNVLYNDYGISVQYGNGTINNNQIGYNLRAGIFLNGNYFSQVCSNRIYANGQNASASSSADRSGIRLEGTNNTMIISNEIRDNTLRGVTSAGVDTGLQMVSNTFSNNPTTFQKSASLSNYIINNNLGYVTENTGSAANATATTFSITHGLAGAATYFDCSFNSTDIIAYTWASSSSTITVTVAGTLAGASYTCYWSAKYVP